VLFNFKFTTSIVQVLEEPNIPMPVQCSPATGGGHVACKTFVLAESLL